MSGSSPGDGAQRDAIAQFNAIQMPSIEEQQLMLQHPEYLGDYQAMMENAQSQGPSAMEGISTDPRLQDAQMAALENLSQMGESGLLPGEEAALRQSRRGAAGEAQAKSAQIMSDMERRGMGGSGAELAARLQASQSSADRMSQESDREMQMAQERALGAISQGGALAGQVRGQQFGEQSDVAKAKDYINQFNTQNQQAVQQRNVANQNQAGMRNLSEQQRIGEAGTAANNTQQQYNKELLQKKFNNQLALAQGKAGQYNQIAQNQMQDAANKGQMMGNMLGAAGTVVGAVYGGPAGAAAGGTAGKAVGGATASDERVKKDIKRFDAKEFLDSLEGYEFNYKHPEKHGEGPQVGVMAQDIEQVMPQMVGQDPDGTKTIDYTKAGGPIMASLADMNSRLSMIEAGKKKG